MTPTGRGRRAAIELISVGLQLGKEGIDFGLKPKSRPGPRVLQKLVAG